MIAFYTGVLLVLVYLVFPGRTAKKRAPGMGPWHYLFCLAFSIIPLIASRVQISWSPSHLIMLFSWSVNGNLSVFLFKRSISFAWLWI